MDQDWISQYYGDSLPDDKKKEESQPTQNQPVKPEPPPKKSSEEKPKPLPPSKKETKKTEQKPDKLLQWIMEEVKKREEIRIAEEKAKDPIQNEALKKVLESAKKLDKQLGIILSETGFTGDSLKTYLDNPKNFSEAEWKYISQYRATMQRKLEMLTGGKPLPETRKANDSKKKSIGSRKHWLDMH